ncbi:acyl-CoA dehydrogenase family protein [Paraburkholderia oxyphila]|uniref:acyl-CoA dehydrogenase family protein n=1 Tax=Paraburkholderia oxyphila TaxID=614212 RepID=UPI00048957D5|nr:acyl-CoA dehydrogenase family protein [Paraburkholderia oxyphila]
MFVDLTPEQQALRREIRRYFAALMTPESREATRGAESGAEYRRLIRQMGQDGWLAVGWPKQYGGHGWSAVEQLIFFEEAQLAEAPLPFVTLNTVGPALMEIGSDAHKARFLPKIAAGELHVAMGYTEPGAGTDLAALQCAAVRDGDHFVINGSKLFTSGAEGADYIWLAARTDPDAPKHKGISIFMVDTREPGFSYTPIHTVGNVRTNATYYDGVRVPADMMIGELNGGWRAITAQLNHERVGLAALGVRGLGLLRRVLAWAREPVPGEDGRRPIDEPWIGATLAEVYARVGAMRLMNYRMAWEVGQGRMNPALASAAKVYGAESMIEICRRLGEVVGTAGLVRRGSPVAALAGDLEEEYRKCQINTFGGGVTEVLRELVAQFGLGLPRTVR